MAHYSIRDLERLSGIKAHTIRIWEKRYGMIAPERTATNIRAYCDAELKKLLNIAILNKNGYKISKIATLSSDEIIHAINKITEAHMESESFLENMAIAMIDLDEVKFEKVLTRVIIQMGFEEAVVQVVYPFFIRMGMMWQTGSIRPAQEHFVSNLIRQKMMVLIDSQITGGSTSARRFTLFLPEGEMHELGLLFAQYMLRKRGHRVVYLGQNVPFEDLLEVERLQPSDFFLTSFVNGFRADDLVAYLHKLHECFPQKNIYLTGSQAAMLDLSHFEHFVYLHTPEDLAVELRRIQSH